SGEARRRLEAAGWLGDARAQYPLEIIWSGPDPDGAIHRLLDFVAALPPGLDLLADEDATRRVAYLAGISKELMRQLTRQPMWLFGSDQDLMGLARSTLVAVAA